MYQFNLTKEEIEIITDALDMALQSNKRMQASKPKFHEIFTVIGHDILSTRQKLMSPANNTVTKK